MLSWDGRYNEARTQFQTVLKQKPDSLDATKGLANVEIWSDHKNQALVVINNGLKYHPRDKDLLKQRDTAQGYSNSLSPDQLRKIYTGGQPEKAKEMARVYLSKNDNIDIHLMLGIMESWDKEYDDSKKQLQTVLGKKPGYTDASLALANVYIFTDDYFKALDIVNAGLRHNPTDVDLLKKRADIIQRINQTNLITPGLFSAFNLAGQVGPYSPGAKMNAVIFNQEMTYVDDLKQIWKITSLGYERYTPYGPIIFSFNQTDRFNSAGNQVVIEAYPHLFEGAYMYLGYGYSTTSYLARNYIGFEPFFSLPRGFEFSAGERILQFRGGVTHLYTGSFAKYIGNYWFALRPYYTAEGSRSYFVTARRYFSSPDSYISLTIGGGKGSNTFDLQNPDSISSNLSRSIRLNGNVPLTQNFIFTWLARYGYEHFPNTNIRQQTDVDAGFIWRF
jgi:YaiO family outer membrane protein